MPQRQKSHAERESAKKKKVASKDYEKNVRSQGTLKVAKDIRSSARWRRVRNMKLAQNPLCQDPFAVHRHREIPATDVDHIMLLRENPDAAYKMENLQSLCKRCHGIKSAQERAAGDTPV